MLNARDGPITISCGDVEPTHDPVVPTAVFKATLLKTLLALPPKVVIAAMQTTTIRASMTAYSTAVGPSSDFTN